MGQTQERGSLLLEKRFPDGRRAEVVRLDGKVMARVFAAGGGLYLEHLYEDIGEATTTILEWDGTGWPLSDRQRRR